LAVSGVSSRGGHGGRGGGSGGRGGRGSGAGRGGKSRDDLDNIVLPRQDFKNLVPFEKNFYVEGPEVQAMSEQEVFTYRARREITVEGRDVPKPVRFFHEANFPGIFKPRLFCLDLI
jgi:ATP-dependent RNA helicase DDX5/DBP2